MSEGSEKATFADIFKRYLDEKAKNAKCNICGGENFFAYGTNGKNKAAYPIIGEGAKFPSFNYLIMILLTCKNCGNTYQFSNLIFDEWYKKNYSENKV